MCLHSLIRTFLIRSAPQWSDVEFTHFARRDGSEALDRGADLTRSTDERAG